MSLPRISEFCCGKSLKFGTYFVGWAEIIFSIIWMSATIFSLVCHEEFVHSIKHIKMLNILTHIFILLCSMISLFSGIFLILSINQEYFGFIGIWVKISVWMLAIIYLRSLVELIMIFVEEDYTEGIFYLVFYAVSLVIFGFCLSVVSSYKKEIDEANAANTLVPRWRF